jgi:hypothetical protein
MGVVKVAVTDAAISFLWALYIAFMRPVSAMLASSFSLLQGKEFYIILALLALNIFVFSLLGRALGGAFWNPTALLAFYCVGTTKDSLFSLALRWPAQVKAHPLHHFPASFSPSPPLCASILFLHTPAVCVSCVHAGCMRRLCTIDRSIDLLQPLVAFCAFHLLCVFHACMPDARGASARSIGRSIYCGLFLHTD